MILEVIATTANDVLDAGQFGADRIELITGIAEGGLTPGPGLIEWAAARARIPVYVMVRPHARSFRYSAEEVETMRSDIRFIRQSGCAGIVLGALKADGTIDTDVLELLLEEADGLGVTFHRAFDEAADLEAALAVLAKYPQIERVLTSGGQPSALDGQSRLVALAAQGGGSGPRLLAGAGLTEAALPGFLRATGIREVHFGRGVRQGGDMHAPLDGEKIARMKQLLASLEADGRGAQ